MIRWDDFDRWNNVRGRYLPEMGQGDTMATQIVAATTKLVYKWFNDGDVYHSTTHMKGWENDLSSYANWLARYAGAKDILDRIYDCRDEHEYTSILYDLCESLLVEEDLALKDKIPSDGDIYDCKGEYCFKRSDFFKNLLTGQPKEQRETPKKRKGKSR